MPSLRFLFPLLGLLLLLAPPVRADELDRLEQEFEVRARRSDERGYEEQREILLAIADLETPQARKALEKIRDDWAERSWRRAGLVLEALVRHAGPKDVDRAIRWAEKSRDPLVVELLGDALGKTRSPTAVKYLWSDALRRATPPVKAQIARALGELKIAAAVPELLRVVQEKDVRARVEALLAVGAIGDKVATSPLEVFLKDEDWEIRAATAEALGDLRDPSALPALLDVLGDEHPRVVEAAAGALGKLGSPDAIDVLIGRLDAMYPKDIRVADALAGALEAITGKPYGIDASAWQEWWNVAREKAFEKETMPEGERTVPGIPYYGFRIRSSRVVFVIDESRSMGWNGRLDRAKRELIRVLESIPADKKLQASTAFNIIAYSDGVDVWENKGIQPATAANVKKAVKFVERLSPDKGTNTYDALRLALMDDEADSVFFLSDGSPTEGPVTDPDRILAEVAVWNRHKRMRIHCILLLIGDPPAAYAGQEDEQKAIEFMERLAAQNGGICEVIRQ